MKRAFDAFCSAIALVLLAPLLLIGIVVAAGSRGCAFYHQERIDATVPHFGCTSSDPCRCTAKGPVTLGTNDPRITSVGRVLRKYKLTNSRSCGMW